MRRVVLCMEGSRGDVQPYMAAATALQADGFSVLAMAPKDAKSMAEQQGLRFVSYPLSSREVTTSAEVVQAVTANDFLKMSAAVNAKKNACRREMVQILFEQLVDFKPELIISSALSMTSCLCIGRVLRIPVIFVGLQVIVPSNHIAVLGVLPKLPGCLDMNKRAWRLILSMLMARGQRTFLDALEKLPPGSIEGSREDWEVSYQEFCDHCSCSPRYPTLFAVSSSLNGPLPPDFNDKCRLLGPIRFDAAKELGLDFGGPEQAALENFLSAGEAPVYMGYGSLVCHSAKFMTLLSLRALKATGRRGILVRGWAGLGLQDIDSEPDAEELRSFCESKVLFMDSAPHANLFPRCSVIVHHGGAGTTYAAATSGVPSVIVPILLDQYVHAKLVNEKGIGVGLPAMRSISPHDLSEAILTCLQSTSIREKAAQLGQGLEKENGAAGLVHEVKQFFEEFIDSGRYVKEKNALLAREKRHRGIRGSCLNWLYWFSSFCQRNERA